MVNSYFPHMARRRGKLSILPEYESTRFILSSYDEMEPANTEGQSESCNVANYTTLHDSQRDGGGGGSQAILGVPRMGWRFLGGKRQREEQVSREREQEGTIFVDRPHFSLYSIRVKT